MTQTVLNWSYMDCVIYVVCLCVSGCVCVSGWLAPGVERWIYDVLGCFYGDNPVFCLQGCPPSYSVSPSSLLLLLSFLPSSSAPPSISAILGPSGLVFPGFGVAMAIATAFLIGG